jgi:hypothetical protein
MRQDLLSDNGRDVSVKSDPPQESQQLAALHSRERSGSGPAEVEHAAGVMTGIEIGWPRCFDVASQVIYGIELAEFQIFEEAEYLARRVNPMGIEVHMRAADR